MKSGARKKIIFSVEKKKGKDCWRGGGGGGVGEWGSEAIEKLLSDFTGVRNPWQYKESVFARQ